MMHGPINIRFTQRRLAKTRDFVDSIHAVFLEKETGLFHPSPLKKNPGTGKRIRYIENAKHWTAQGSNPGRGK